MHGLEPPRLAAMRRVTAAWCRVQRELARAKQSVVECEPGFKESLVVFGAQTTTTHIK